MREHHLQHIRDTVAAHLVLSGNTHVRTDAIETVAAPPKHSAIEHTITLVFEKAGINLGRKPEFSVKRTGKGWLISVTAQKINLTFKGMMRLRAYLTHYFHVKDFSISPIGRVANSIGIKYTILVKSIKKDKDGVRKLVERNVVPGKKPVPNKKPIVKKKPSAKKRIKTKAELAFARIRSHAQLLYPGE